MLVLSLNLIVKKLASYSEVGFPWCNNINSNIQQTLLSSLYETYSFCMFFVIFFFFSSWLEGLASLAMYHRCITLHFPLRFLFPLPSLHPLRQSDVSSSAGLTCPLLRLDRAAPESEADSKSESDEMKGGEREWILTDYETFHLPSISLPSIFHLSSPPLLALVP